VYISPTLGDALLEPIATTFCNSLYLTDVINRSKFGIDWYGSFGSGEVQSKFALFHRNWSLLYCSAERLQVILVFFAILHALDLYWPYHLIFLIVLQVQYLVNIVYLVLLKLSMTLSIYHRLFIYLRCASEAC